ncbi:carbon-nitrogen family hydrolase [Paenisporosarcina quisquiliarum]|uniref:Carbon-nitrogen family hydrolase n=1 Tax=Paenisporosarcina quisquiliarum TaxID=365346 RepID=A0A9X3LIA7_9BACL|nr:carbon-nitrogen family hydrolase [Paenisporosarcina quisquiliarum]MCZ8537531.1 carbon-nitrogen family hydrolase [Paenisporosarcina quisquiliarum]
MKIACIQLDVAFAEPEKNFSNVQKYIKKVASEGAELVVLPEMWNTAYALTQLEQLADPEGQRTKEVLSELARTYHVHIVGGSVSTKKGDHFYNTMYVFSNEGELVAEYDKAHLFRLMDEHLYLQAGNQANVFSLGSIQAGGVICYDLRFPEWLRAHALAGAKVLFLPAQWPETRIDHWKILLQARAIENQCFVIAVNRTGDDPNNQFNGQSMIIAPWGKVLWTGAEHEEYAVIDVDFSEVEEVRTRIPVYEDRRPSLYEPLFEK